MVAKIYKKSVIVICDCIDCKNKPIWRQGFIIKRDLVVVDLCEDHHYILRTKVPNEIPLNEDVLKWLLIQDSNPQRVVKYGIVNRSSDVEFLRELDKIDIELE